MVDGTRNGRYGRPRGPGSGGSYGPDFAYDPWIVELLFDGPTGGASLGRPNPPTGARSFGVGMCDARIDPNGGDVHATRSGLTQW